MSLQARRRLGPVVAVAFLAVCCLPLGRQPPTCYGFVHPQRRHHTVVLTAPAHAHLASHRLFGKHIACGAAEQSGSVDVAKTELLAAIDRFNEVQARDGKEAVDFGVKGGELDSKTRAPRNLAAGGAYYKISEDLGRAADAVFSAVDHMAGLESLASVATSSLGTPEGESCPLHGEWRLLFTTAADASFSKNSTRGDAKASNVVDGVAGTVTNVINFLPGDSGQPPVLEQLRVRIAATALSPSKVGLQFKYVKARVTKFFGIPLFGRRLTLTLPVPGPFLTRLICFFTRKTPPKAFFEVLQPSPAGLQDSVYFGAEPARAPGVSKLRGAAAPSAEPATSGLFVAGAIALAAAAVVSARSAREESLLTMFGKHDRKTFHGKLHGHTFGKYRLRKGKARRLKAVKNGTFDSEKVVQHGQPEPEHVWDMRNILKNKMYYFPEYVRETVQDCLDYNAELDRAIWEKKMGKYGKQEAYINWTPPGET